MNFNLGRYTLPSTKAENMIEMLRASRTDALKANNSIQLVGDVKTPVVNQAVQGGVNVINPAITTVRQIPLVVDRKRRPLKTENKRKDVQATEALWDIRNCSSLNNATRTNPTYYTDKLREKVQSRVRMSNTAEAMRAQYPSDSEEYFLGDRYAESQNVKPAVGYNFEGFSFVDAPGTAKTSNLNGPEVATPSYNPFLSNTRGNYSDPTGAKTSYPDERITRYGGERKYMSKGDKILRAADLLKSDKMKERWALQAQAHDALTGAAHAPRMLGSNIAQGINSTSTYNARADAQLQGYRESGYKDTNVLTSAELAQNKFDLNEITKSSGVNSSAPRQINAETYVPRTHDLSRQVEIQQAYNNYYDPAISQAQQKLNNNDIKRKLYGDNTYTEYFDQDNQSSEQTLWGGIVSTFKGWFGISDKSEGFDESLRGKLDNSSIIKQDYDDIIQAYSEIYGNTSLKERGKISADKREQIQEFIEDYSDVVESLSEILEDDELSLAARQAFNKDTREQAKEFIEDYTSTVKNDPIIKEALKSITERCIINDSVRDFDEDKFINEILNSEIINERLDELKIRVSRNMLSQKSALALRDVCENYDESIISGWLEQSINTLNLKRIKIDPYYTERGMREDYINSNAFTEICKPVGIITSNGIEITRNILTISDKGKYIILQRREYSDEADDVSYVYDEIKPEELEKILRKKVEKINANRSDDIINLTYEDHVKLINYIEEKPDTGIIITDRPIHQYQRDILDDANMTKHFDTVSNVSAIVDSSIYNDEYITSKHKAGTIATFRDSDEQLYIGSVADVDEVDKRDRIYNIDSTKFAYGRDQKTMYKKFGEMM